MPNHSVGILLETPVLNRIVSGKPTHEKAELYIKCGNQIGLSPILFDLKGLDLAKGRVTGYVWNPSNKRYIRTVRPIPQVIHKRILKRSPKLTTLGRRLGKKLFNPPINRNKLWIHHLLRKRPELRPHLPDTRKLDDPDQGLKMIQRYSTVFIKPTSGSLGNYISKIVTTDNKQYLLQTHKGKAQALSEGQLKQELAKKCSSNRDYFLQQGIPLARYRGSPFDLRVSVQRGGDGRWQISGVVARVAPQNGMLTNLSQNGRAVPATTVLTHAFPDKAPRNLLRKVRSLAIEICRTLEKTYPAFADAGLDIGIDQKGKPWFIEVNFRDLRYSFRSAGEYRLFKKTYLNPMRYAKYLLSKNGGVSGQKSADPSDNAFQVLSPGNGTPSKGEPLIQSVAKSVHKG